VYPVSIFLFCLEDKKEKLKTKKENQYPKIPIPTTPIPTWLSQ